MRLIIKHNAGSGLVLPINYNHILQGMIYRKISAYPELAEGIHDEGWQADGKSFKMFQFSKIYGHFSVRSKKITFDGNVAWEIRSLNRGILEIIREGIERDGLDYVGQKFTDVEAVLVDGQILTDHVKISMSTPMCVYTTEGEHTTYYSPDETCFYQMLAENFAHKYYAFTGELVTDLIEIQPVRVTARDKVVTTYKGRYITAWGGIYELMGDPDYLDFLYNTGLGSRNSQGFGMFDIEE